MGQVDQPQAEPRTATAGMRPQDSFERTPRRAGYPALRLHGRERDMPVTLLPASTPQADRGVRTSSHHYLLLKSSGKVPTT